jgi:hypothetical protein
MSCDKELKMAETDLHLLGTYTCRDNDDVLGRLTVLATGVSFSPTKKPSSAQGWSMLFEELKEIHKVNISLSWPAHPWPLE